MVQRIIKKDEMLAVPLPEETAKALGLEEGSEVSVKVDRERRQLIIELPELELSGVDERFAQQVADFIEQYRPALEALAQ